MPKKKIDKKVKEKIKEKSSTSKEFYIERSSSGATTLDNALGGGFPFGKMINIVGDKSSGKTILASQIIAEAYYKYKDKLKWKYRDVEAGFSFDTKNMLNIGIDICPFDENDKPPKTIEEFSIDLKKQLRALADDEFLIYVLDSFDSLSCQAEIDRDNAMEKAIEEGTEIDKGGYKMEKPKALGEFFRLRVQDIKYKNCMLIIISQTRQKIGVTFGDKHTRNGGSALDFYAAVIIWLAEASKELKLGEVISVCIKANIRKNKVGKPYRKSFFNILYDYGVDRTTSNIEYLYDLRTDKGELKKKIKLDWEGEEFTRLSLLKYIEDNNLEEELNNKVINKYLEIQEKIAPKRKGRQ